LKFISQHVSHICLIDVCKCARDLFFVVLLRENHIAFSPQINNAMSLIFGEPALLPLPLNPFYHRQQPPQQQHYTLAASPTTTTAHTADALSGFDEFPSPLLASDLALLEQEIVRLTKAHRSLTQALFFYSKHVDKAHGDVVTAERRLDAFDKTSCDNNQTSTAVVAREVGVEDDVLKSGKRPRSEDQEDVPTASSTTTVPAAPAASAPVPEDAGVPPAAVDGRPRRRFTQSAALLAGMQKMIAANQKRDVASGIGGDSIRQERERMAREARRNTLVDHVNIAKGNASKAAKAVRELQEKMDPVRGRLATLSSLLDTAEIQEADYTSSFFLRCSSISNNSESDEPTSPPLQTTDAPPITGTASYQVALYGGCADYIKSRGVVYVQPARHNDTTKAVVRQQLYSMLDSYLSFRGLIDPVLTSIKDARDAFLEKRRRQMIEAQEQQNDHHQLTAANAAKRHVHSAELFVPMSPEEASWILRSSGSSNTTTTTAALHDHPQLHGAADKNNNNNNMPPVLADVVPEQQSELEWSVYESAMAALDDFE
jgi:hypothetical protein